MSRWAAFNCGVQHIAWMWSNLHLVCSNQSQQKYGQHKDAPNSDDQFRANSACSFGELPLHFDGDAFWFFWNAEISDNWCVRARDKKVCDGQESS